MQCSCWPVKDSVSRKVSRCLRHHTCGCPETSTCMLFMHTHTCTHTIHIHSHMITLRHVHLRHVFKDFITSNAATVPSDQTPALRGDKVGKVSSFEHDSERRSLQSRMDAEDHPFPHQQHQDLPAPQDPRLLPKRKTSPHVNASTRKETVSATSV